MKNTKSNQKYNIDGYERLAVAVVKKAVEDYWSALKRLHRHPKAIQANKILDDCERFFNDEISYYSDLDGLAIKSAVQKRVDEEMSENG